MTAAQRDTVICLGVGRGFVSFLVSPDMLGRFPDRLARKSADADPGSGLHDVALDVTTDEGAVVAALLGVGLATVKQARKRMRAA